MMIDLPCEPPLDPPILPLPINVVYCFVCGEPIMDGEVFLSAGGCDYCSECVDNMNGFDILGILKVDLDVACYDS